MYRMVVIKGEKKGSESVEENLLHLLNLHKHDLYIRYGRVHEA